MTDYHSGKISFKINATVHECTACVCEGGGGGEGREWENVGFGRANRLGHIHVVRGKLDSQNAWVVSW